MDKIIIRRKDAIKLGLLTYYTGKPCKNNHLSNRYVKCRRCIRCNIENCKKYNLKNLESERSRKRTYMQLNSEKRRSLRQAYRAANKEVLKLKLTEYRVKHSEKIKKTSKRYRLQNPERMRALFHSRRARKKNAEGKYTAKQVKALHLKQNFKCVNCKISIKSSYHVDHIMPLKLGGSNDIKNIQLLCPKCNTKKNAKHPIDWARENGRLL